MTEGGVTEEGEESGLEGRGRFRVAGVATTDANDLVRVEGGGEEVGGGLDLQETETGVLGVEEVAAGDLETEEIGLVVLPLSSATALEMAASVVTFVENKAWVKDLKVEKTTGLILPLKFFLTHFSASCWASLWLPDGFFRRSVLRAFSMSL